MNFMSRSISTKKLTIMALIPATALLLSVGCNGPSYVNRLDFCAHIKKNGKPVDNAHAVFTFRWTVNGSPFSGHLEEDVVAGETCVSGGVGISVDKDSFKLISVQASVTNNSDGSTLGSASAVPSYSYNDTSKDVYGEGTFELGAASATDTTIMARIKNFAELNNPYDMIKNQMMVSDRTTSNRPVQEFEIKAAPAAQSGAAK